MISLHLIETIAIVLIVVLGTLFEVWLKIRK
jgi:hypothetical protein